MTALANCARRYRKPIDYGERDEGGHFATGKKSGLPAAELRAAFRFLR